MEIALKDGTKATGARTNSFGWLLRTLGGRMDAAMRQDLSRLGLDLPSFATLMTLFDQEGVTQAGLGVAVGVPSYATTRTLDRMEQLGLVERHRDPRSRRSYRILLTTKARGLRRELIAVVRRVNEDVLQHLEPSERSQVVSWLQQLELATRG